MEGKLPPSWADQPCCLGVDEAGRGPVLGPMVYGAAYCPISQKEAVAARAFADSKTLTEEKRERLFQQIQEDADIGYAVDSISASDISTQMLRSDKVSLNEIAMKSTFRLIDEVLSLGVVLKEVFCDTVGDATRWRQSLESKFPTISFTVCPKADALYPIVSAASIVAKVTRDQALQAFLHEEENLDLASSVIGSGYPADPLTVAWLKANVDPVFGYPKMVRFSWQTTSKLLQEMAVPMIWECDDEGDSRQSTLAFETQGRSKRGASNALNRHSFFRSRKLQRLDQM